MTDQDGLYNDDPKKNKKANLIKNISVKNKNLNNYAKPSNNNLGRGGMVTKVLAAKKAAKSNTRTIICNGSKKDILIKILEKNNSMVQLLPMRTWLLNQKNNG